MKLHHLDRSSVPDQSFTVSHNLYSHFLKVWHFHEQLELVYVLQSSGIRFIGDDIERFEEGDIVLTGKNLPHMWLNDDQYFDGKSQLQAEAVAIHFREDMLDNIFFKTPELSHLGSMLRLAIRGIKFNKVDDQVKKNLEDMISADSSMRLIKLLEILDSLSKSKDYRIISSDGYLDNAHHKEDNRLKEMYEYIFQNFNAPIKSSDLADVMCMNNSAFSRFSTLESTTNT